MGHSRKSWDIISKLFLHRNEGKHPKDLSELLIFWDTLDKKDAHDIMLLGLELIEAEEIPLPENFLIMLERASTRTRR